MDAAPPTAVHRPIEYRDTVQAQVDLCAKALSSGDLARSREGTMALYRLIVPVIGDEEAKKSNSFKAFDEAWENRPCTITDTGEPGEDGLPVYAPEPTLEDVGSWFEILMRFLGASGFLYRRVTESWASFPEPSNGSKRGKTRNANGSGHGSRPSPSARAPS